MKVVLRQDVEKLGEKGTVQNVKDGFARNYLIPKGLAVLATPGELRTVTEQQRITTRKIEKQEREMQSLADQIAGQRLVFTARAGTQGRLYGSVTAGDIAEKLQSLVKHEIDRRKIQLSDPIRQLGEHTVVVNLVGRLKPEITVVVEADATSDAEVADKEVTSEADVETDTTGEDAAGADSTEK